MQGIPGIYKNRKVVNASQCTLEGKVFRSKQEMRMWLLLKGTSLRYEHEPEQIVLAEKFRPSRPWYRKGKKQSSVQRALTYLPDFVIYGKDTKYIIDVKGFQTDRYMIKRRLLLQWMETLPGYVFFEVHTVADMKHCIETINKLENDGTERKQP